MSIFKGKEELEEMNKSDVVEFMKNIMCPNRFRGGLTHHSDKKMVMRKTWRNEWYEHELVSPYIREKVGFDMSFRRPIIDDREYTWGELDKYPAPLLKVLAYRLWQKHIGSGEE